MNAHTDYSSWDEVVSSFPETMQEDIASIRENNGCLTADRVEKILLETNAEIGTLMISLLPVAAQYAIVPISNFHVGAVAAGAPVGGFANLYLGANIEYTGLALTFSMHAEQSASNNAWIHGETMIQALAISAAPCGYCRQFLNEIVMPSPLSILLPTGTGNQYTLQPLPFYLPNAFGPSDLGMDGGLMNPKYCTHNLKLTGGSTDPFILQALAAAQSCYAPYTSGFAGVAVKLDDGSVYTGRYAENAAYNPSMSPLESALGFMNMNQPRTGSRTVVRGALVEVPSKAGQFAVTQAALASYAPGVTLEYYTAAVVS